MGGVHVRSTIAKAEGRRAKTARPYRGTHPRDQRPLTYRPPPICSHPWPPPVPWVCLATIQRHRNGAGLTCRSEPLRAVLRIRESAPAKPTPGCLPPPIEAILGGREGRLGPRNATQAPYSAPLRAKRALRIKSRARSAPRVCLYRRAQRITRTNLGPPSHRAPESTPGTP